MGIEIKKIAKQKEGRLLQTDAGRGTKGKYQESAAKKRKLIGDIKTSSKQEGWTFPGEYFKIDVIT